MNRDEAATEGYTLLPFWGWEVYRKVAVAKRQYKYARLSPREVYHHRPMAVDRARELRRLTSDSFVTKRVQLALKTAEEA